MRRTLATNRSMTLMPQAPGSGWTWSWKRAVVGWVLGLAVMALGLGVFGHSWINAYRLAHDGKTTTGVITKLLPEKHDGCEYAYVVNGRTYSHSEETCGASRRLGDHLEITYIAATPSVATALGKGTVLWDYIAVTLLLTSLFGFALCRRRHSNTELPYQRGFLTAGTI